MLGRGRQWCIVMGYYKSNACWTSQIYTNNPQDVIAESKSNLCTWEGRDSGYIQNELSIDVKSGRVVA
jgi:hypothetical protein